MAIVKQGLLAFVGPDPGFSYPDFGYLQAHTSGAFGNAGTGWEAGFLSDTQDETGYWNGWIRSSSGSISWSSGEGDLQLVFPLVGTWDYMLEAAGATPIADPVGLTLTLKATAYGPEGGEAYDYGACQIGFLPILRTIDIDVPYLNEPFLWTLDITEDIATDLWAALEQDGGGAARVSFSRRQSPASEASIPNGIYGLIVHEAYLEIEVPDAPPLVGVLAAGRRIFAPL